MGKRKVCPRIEIHGSAVRMTGGVKLALAAESDRAEFGILSDATDPEGVTVVKFKSSKLAAAFHKETLDTGKHLSGADDAEWHY